MIRSVLIADDEPNAREFLKRLIDSRDDLKLVGTLNNGQEVLNFCQTFMPDILILDIEMPGLNGIETARALSRKLSQSVIIFSTAYDQYAIDAFNVAAMGYLLKPFNKVQLDQVIDRAIFQLVTQDKAAFSEKIQKVWERLDKKPNVYLEEFHIKEKGLVRTVSTQDIIYLESDSEYVKLHTARSTYLHRAALSVLEHQLPPDFKRIHRSFILNIQAIESHKYLSDTRFEFLMKNQDKLTSSRSYRASINVWLTE